MARERRSEEDETRFFHALSFLMQLLTRPGFYVIVLLIGAMLLLTMWMSWKLEGLPKRKGAQEKTPAAVSHGP
jgi:hypothetical protein